MEDLVSMQRPITPAEKSAWSMNFRASNPVTEFPFCHRKYKGAPAVCKHLKAIIQTGGDEDPDLEKVTKWRENSQKGTKKAQYARKVAKRKLPATGTEEEQDDAVGEETEAAEEAEDLEPKSKRQKTHEIPVSNNYERYRRDILYENSVGCHFKV